MKTYFLIGALLLFCLHLQAQLGCTDPQANNYDGSATVNDGSCIYPETAYTLTFISELPQSLKESSGLVVLPEGIYTHNDAGNPSEIYQIDSLNGSVLQTVLVVGENEDWEDMAESETHIFLGDFGNNNGNRTNLRIYRIAKSELSNNIVNAQPINFAYADQLDFTEKPNNNDYDCEAFFYHNDSLHLFTKNWVNNKTRHYSLPAEPGFYSVSPKHTFDAEGLITSADINDEGTVLLLGYTEVGLNFMWLLFDYAVNDFFNGNKRKIGLGSALVNSQTESLAFKDIHTGYISSEQFDVGQVELSPKLLSFNIEQWLSETVSTKDGEEMPDIKLFPNPFFDQITILLPIDWPVGETEIRLLGTNGQILLSKSTVSPFEEIVLKASLDWPAGIYVVQLLNGDAFWQKRVVK